MYSVVKTRGDFDQYKEGFLHGLNEVDHEGRMFHAAHMVGNYIGVCLLRYDEKVADVGMSFVSEPFNLFEDIGNSHTRCPNKF